MTLIPEIFIAVFGISAIWLSQDRRQDRRRWSPVLGLCAQPFWFYETYTHAQWGIFILCCIYSVAWARGICTYWALFIKGNGHA